MRVYARHGLARQEQVAGNDFEVTLEVTANMDEAFEHDILSKTINYSRLVKIIREEMAITSQLLENVVFRIYRRVTDEFVTISGGITVTKLTPPMAGCEVAGVSVTYRWRADE